MDEKMTGHLHPITIAISEMQQIFASLGFEIALGPEVETEHYNFDALNIPSYHPARDMWDTFWLKPENSKKLLRTHTSPVQIRYMESHKIFPIQIIAPGKVFRHEATDATHEAQFHQLEGLAIGTDISLGNLKWVLEEFFKAFFKKHTEIRFRPSYFPFVEPGVEVDILFNGKWLEVVGAGMVHPQVLANVGIDSKVYQGFAFGFGVDRLVMLKYGITDVRDLYTGDLRLVNQF